MLFADDIVLIGESREEINGKLKIWRQAPEAHHFHLSRRKMEYMKYKFSKEITNSSLEVKIGTCTIPQITHLSWVYRTK